MMDLGCSCSKLSKQLHVDDKLQYPDGKSAVVSSAAAVITALMGLVHKNIHFYKYFFY